jgi:small-conductance mechanosensitive channel
MLDWSYTLLGNTVLDYATALLAFAVLVLIFKIFQSLILKRLRKLSKSTATEIDDMLVGMVETLRPPFYLFLGFYLALSFLEINIIFEKLINIILVAWIVFQIVLALQVVVDYGVKKWSRREKERGAKSAYQALGKLAKIILWAGALLFVLSNLGVNITSLVAGLGIGGVAVAFALQNILNDLFSSFAIYFDKPFVVGDFIVVGSRAGVVEKIGIKTTRVRALQGEEIVISNRELTSTQIQNFKRMHERRVVLSFGVVYETPNALLEKIPKIVEKVVKSVELTRFDRAHFFRFDDSSLTFEAVYYVGTGDYNKYMDINEKILLGIKGSFEKEGIQMAYPTRVIYQKRS